MYDKITAKSIDSYLENMKNIIINGGRIILSNRDKNMFFCEEYGIHYDEIKNLLLNLEVNDFCKVLDNKGINVSEKLYLFAPILVFNNKNIQIYLKLNIISDRKIIILVSLHKSEHLLKTKFNEGVV